MSHISFTVHGEPVAQGSPKIGRHGRRPVLVIDSDELAAWRRWVTLDATVAARAYDNWVTIPRQVTVRKKKIKTVARVCFDEPVIVQAVFYFKTPKCRNDGDVHYQKPDLDKLQRAIGDALTDAKIVSDDCRIVAWPACPAKFYGTPRAEISVESLAEYVRRSRSPADP
jgi:crossover junction endodeoxyribonuclease RusA